MNLDDFKQELTSAGIRGRLQARIVAEFDDHLHENPNARLGEPKQLARQFADELGTSRARSAAFTAFGALALLGITVVARLASFFPLKNSAVGGDTAGLMVCFVAAQIALASGGLGLLRAWRLRHQAAIPQPEAAILARRAGVGLLAGVVAALAVPLHAELTKPHNGGTDTGSLILLGISLLIALSAVPSLISAGAVRPQIPGTESDLAADLGPLSPILGRSITRFALLVALAMFVLLGAAGVVADDPFDGMIRGIAEGGVFLASYAVLGRYLAIRAA